MTGEAVRSGGKPDEAPAAVTKAGPAVQPTLDKRVFLPTFILVVVAGAILVLNPERAESALNASWKIVTGYFSWLYLLVAVVSIAALSWLAFGRYGSVKLGGPEDEPEFSTLSWISMMFTAGIGIGLVYWAFVEPIYYLRSPPFGIEPGGALAAEWAHMYGKFHWGIVPWTIYALPALPIAYALYVRKEPFSRISAASGGALGKWSGGWLGIGIDVIVILGIIGAAGTTMGLSLPLVTALVSQCLSVPDTLMLKIGVLIMWTAVFGTSVYLGLDQGIRHLANLNLVIGLGFLIFMLIVGPTVFILSMTTNSIGLMFDNIFRMSFWLDPVSKGGFPETWTVFYWGWWIGYAPMVGLFVARISRGRTIKQVILGEVVWGSLGCWAFFAVFGGYSIHAELNGILDIAGILDERGIPAAIISILGSLPGGKITLLMFTVLAIVFLATTLDSSAYVLASVSTKNLAVDGDPARWNRFAWAFALAIISVGLITMGGLEAVKTSTVIVALPLIPVLFILQLSLFNWLRKDFGKALRPTSYALDRHADGSADIREV